MGEAQDKVNEAAKRKTPKLPKLRPNRTQQRQKKPLQLQRQKPLKKLKTFF